LSVRYVKEVPSHV